MWDLEADLIDHEWTTGLKPTYREARAVHKTYLFSFTGQWSHLTT